MALISVNDVTIAFEDAVAVRGASFTVEEGDYLVILGENGSGKTSLMRAMLGLVKPKSGTITYDSGLNRREIGYLPQQTRVQRDFPATVGEVVYSGLVGAMRKPFFLTKAQKSRADEKMALTGVLQMKDRNYRTLSGGQQQRALLARALCATDKLLLLDEPVTGLDAESTEEMYRLIKALNDGGTAIVTISHDRKDALRDAKHVLIMNENRVEYFGEKDT